MSPNFVRVQLYTHQTHAVFSNIKAIFLVIPRIFVNRVNSARQRYNRMVGLLVKTGAERIEAEYFPVI